MILHQYAIRHCIWMSLPHFTRRRGREGICDNPREDQFSLSIVVGRQWPFAVFVTLRNDWGGSHDLTLLVILMKYTQEAKDLLTQLIEPAKHSEPGRVIGHVVMNAVLSTVI